MGRKNKLQKFRDVDSFSNVLQARPSGSSSLQNNQNQIIDHRGNWAREYFQNHNEIFLELGCGKGEYTIGLAQKFPENNYIGIDVKGARIWKGARKALEEKLDNVLFMRLQVFNLPDVFASGEIAGIWITFPDPYPPAGEAKKRLTSPRYLEYYKKVLKQGGLIHLKTDDPDLFKFSLDSVRENGAQIKKVVPDVYADYPDDILQIQTFYEEMHLKAGRKISYLEFSFD